MKKILSLIFILSITLFAFDINTASKSELMQLKGIGAKKAESIIKYRKEHGKFKSIDELTKVKGIGPKLLEKIKSSLKNPKKSS
ncbi:MAG: helix-hairpin-helix domain-containing protein [Epsilonproteobacteria bacterium]|nr:helix-hairpin-helix domain-containing protein [Campylobacterota bacterium]